VGTFWVIVERMSLVVIFGSFHDFDEIYEQTFGILAFLNTCDFSSVPDWYASESSKLLRSC